MEKDGVEPDYVRKLFASIARAAAVAKIVAILDGDDVGEAA
jgi:hypothetical protein